VSDNDTSHFAGIIKNRERNGWKDDSSDDCQKTCTDVTDVTRCGSSFYTYGRSGDRKSSVADSWQPCTTDNRWGWRWAKTTTTSLEELVIEVWWRCHVQKDYQQCSSVEYTAC